MLFFFQRPDNNLTSSHAFKHKHTRALTHACLHMSGHIHIHRRRQTVKARRSMYSFIVSVFGTIVCRKRH